MDEKKQKEQTWTNNLNENENMCVFILQLPEIRLS